MRYVVLLDESDYRWLRGAVEGQLDVSGVTEDEAVERMRREAASWRPPGVFAPDEWHKLIAALEAK